MKKLFPVAGQLVVTGLVFYFLPGQPASAQELKERATLNGHNTEVRCLAFSPDGKILASGSYGERADKNQYIGVLKLWDVATGKELASLKGHPNSVLSVAFTPDGKTLASGGAELVRGRLTGIIKVWDVPTRTERATIKAHNEVVYSVAFSPDGTTLASGSYDNTVKLWDVATGKEKATLKGHKDHVTSVAFSPDGITLASGSWDKTIRLWRVTTGRRIAKLIGHQGWVTSVAFSADGKTLASGSFFDRVRLWDVAPAKERATLQSDTSQHLGLAFTANGRTLVSGGGQVGRSGMVKLWEMATGKEQAAIKRDNGLLWAVAISPDGKTLAATADNTVKLWDVGAITKSAAARPPDPASVTAGTRPPDPVPARVTLTAHGDTVRALAFSPDGKMLASCDGEKEVRIWEVPSGKQKAVLPRHWSAVKAVAFAPVDQVLASSDGYNVRLWDLPSASVKATLKSHARGLAFSPDGKTLAAEEGSPFSGKVTLWDVSSQKARTSLEMKWEVRCIALSPDGKILATGGSDKSKPPFSKDLPVVLRLWDTATGQERTSFMGHKRMVTCLAFSSDGRLLASGSHGEEGELKLWDMASEKERPDFKAKVKGAEAVAFSRDGRVLAVVDFRGAIRLLEATTSLERAILEYPNTFTCLAIAPDDKTLAAGCDDGIIKLWDLAGLMKAAK